ncbi:hypothetical protein [Streptomyces pilosus]|uniref:Uncharacterized protein n=1 Tax=Streptomyces pilosus TaxID=28893 RepID=A0A918F4N1_9ACTN|nr:hypothetical protein [Streptomyces pilosus]GGR04182.1 hypothetical protein GCM10010280_60180 [Streptomyces pilosus]
MSDLGLWLGELAVFDATVATVPCLWDLAATETVTCRPEVIELLQTILEHNAAQIDVQRQAHRAVLDGASTANRLTGDADPAVRRAASKLTTAINNHLCDACHPT